MIGPMKLRLTYVFVALLAFGPAQAQDTPTEDDSAVARGLNLLREGTELLLGELMDQIGPTLEGLEGRLVDLNAYHAPEVLPNGDIIIRRKVPIVPSEPAPDAQIDL